jgi:hypothetical protein
MLLLSVGALEYGMIKQIAAPLCAPVTGYGYA